MDTFIIPTTSTPLSYLPRKGSCRGQHTAFLSDHLLASHSFPRTQPETLGLCSLLPTQLPESPGTNSTQKPPLPPRHAAWSRRWQINSADEAQASLCLSQAPAISFGQLILQERKQNPTFSHSHFVLQLQNDFSDELGLSSGQVRWSPPDAHLASHPLSCPTLPTAGPATQRRTQGQPGL